MKKVLVVLPFFLLTALSPAYSFALSSDNYIINSDSVNSGGVIGGNSSSYTVSDTIGQNPANFSTSQNYSLFSGYQLSQATGTAATTTTTPPPPPPGGGGGGGGGCQGSYSTCFPPPGVGTTTVPSIYNFYAQTSNNDILLFWTNPSDPRFAGVKIVRSSVFFPLTPNEGTIVYVGNGTSAIDANLIQDTNYYYSAFSYDTSGNFSSGQYLEIYLGSTYVVPPYIPPTTTNPPKTPSSTTTVTTSTTTTTVTSTTTQPISNPDITNLNSNVYTFIQDGKKITVSLNTVYVDFNKSLQIIVDTSTLPFSVKNLILKIQDPQNGKNYSYVFTPDSNGTTFRLTLTKFPNEGVFPFTITAYDVNNKPTNMVQGFFNVQSHGMNPIIYFGTLLLTLLSKINWLYFSLLLILLIILWLIWKNRKKKNDDYNNHYKI